MKIEAGQKWMETAGTYPQSEVTIDSSDGFTVRFHPSGGGFVRELHTDVFELHYQPVPEKLGPVMYAARFAIDATGEEGEESFPGFTDGRLWNGWATPHFTLETAREVMSWLYDECEEWNWKEEGEKFIATPAEPDEYSEPYIWEPSTIVVDGVEHKVWAIGAWSHIWDEV